MKLCEAATGLIGFYCVISHAGVDSLRIYATKTSLMTFALCPYFMSSSFPWLWNIHEPSFVALVLTTVRSLLFWCPVLSVLLIVARRDMTVVCRAVHLYSNLHLIKLPKLLETEPLLLKGRTMIILEFFCPGIESVLYYKNINFDSWHFTRCTGDLWTIRLFIVK